MKKSIAIGIILLFILSTVSSIAFGFDSKASEYDELEQMLDNLRYVCTTPRGFDETKYEYYNEQLLNQYLDDDLSDFEVVEEVEKTVNNKQQAMSIIANGPMDSPWPMQSHDVHHTGLSSYSTADNPYDEKWRFYFSGGLDDGTVIDNDGVIYCKGAYNALDRYLYAIYPNGTEKWKYKTGGLIWGSTPAIAEDGTVYVGSWDGQLYAINPNGTRKWVFLSGSNIASSPAIAEDGTIYFGTMSPGYRIYAVNPDGTEKWCYQTGDVITSDPVIGDDGAVYIGSCDNYLYALWPNGTLRWRFTTGDEIHGDPAIGDDGTVYIASWDDYLYALYPNGTLKWKRSGFGNDNSVAIDEDGIIYVGADNIYALYPNGTTKWTFELGDRDVGKSSPAISADGTIYIGVEIGQMGGGEIIAIKPNGTEKWRKTIAKFCVDSSPCIAEDGTVYIGSYYEMSEGYLYAFGAGELTADANGPYYGLTDQAIQFTGSSSGGYSPHSYFWDFGDTQTSEEQKPIHTYTTPGNYTIVLTVTDNKSNFVTDTTYAWIQTTNSAPDKPTINGSTHGAAGMTYDYKFTATDPDNSIVYLYVDWGDNTNTGWLGPYNNGQQVTLGHSWSEQNTYTIRVKAKDPYDAEGPWGTLNVTMPKNKNLLQSPFWYRVLERFPILQKVFSYLME